MLTILFEVRYRNTETNIHTLTHNIHLTESFNEFINKLYILHMLLRQNIKNL